MPEQIKLDVLVCAVRAAGGEADHQQVECMLANLIHQGLVKGYIAHKQVFECCFSAASASPLRSASSCRTRLRCSSRLESLSKGSRHVRASGVTPRVGHPVCCERLPGTHERTPAITPIRKK